jgi:hypothetical protein
MSALRPVACLVVLFSAATALADAPLTETQVKSVIATTRELQPLVAKHQDEWQAMAEEQQKQPGRDRDPCKMPQSARSKPGYREMEGVVRKNGFADGEDYCRVSLRVYATCGAVGASAADPNWRETLGNRGQIMAQARAQIENARKQVEANPNLTPEQKQQMYQKMAQAMADTEEINSNPMLATLEKVSDADMKAAQPHCQELEKTVREAPAAPQTAPAR